MNRLATKSSIPAKGSPRRCGILAADGETVLRNGDAHDYEDHVKAQAARPHSPDPGKERVTGVKRVKRVNFPTLAAEAYHGLTGQFLKAVAPLTEATDAGVLAHWLSIVGTLIGPKIYFLSAGGKQWTRFHACLVGPTNSGRKGTSEVPIALLMERTARKFWKAQRTSGLSSGEGLIARLEDKESKEGKIIYAEKRLQVVESEFGKVLVNIDREGNTLSHIMQQAYDSGDLCTLTVNARSAMGTHICTIAHSTEYELMCRLNDREKANGWFNRFVIFAVRSEKIIGHCQPIDDELFDPFKNIINALFLLGGEAKERALVMDADAKRYWWDEKQPADSSSLYVQLREDRLGLVGAMTARGASMVLRFAMIYALLNSKVAKSKVGPTISELPEIRVEHLKAAKAVWDYSVASVETIFQGMTGNPLADKIIRLLQNNGPMTSTDFNRHLSKSERHKETKGKALTLLLEQRIIKADVEKGEPSRPTTRWSLVEEGQGN